MNTVYVLSMIITWVHTGDYDVYNLNVYKDPSLCEAIRQQTICNAPIDHPLLKKEKYYCKLGCFPERVEPAPVLHVLKD